MSDSEPPRRKILSLKSGVAAPGGPPPPTGDFKCKPCGARFDPPAELADEDSVRCPSCNARLGLAADFRADPPRVEKLRARYLKK